MYPAGVLVAVRSLSRNPLPSNNPLVALQKCWDRLRAGLDLILDQRCADMADLPGGASGSLAREARARKPIGW